MTDIIGQLQRNRDAQSDAERSRAADRTSRATDPRAIAPDAIVEVKVISRRESTLLEDYDPTGIETAINAELAGGWRLVSTQSFADAGHVARRSTVLLFFERPVQRS